MTKKTAKFIQDLDNFKGEARLYEVSPALEGFSHVVVSGVNAFGMGFETFIFGSDENGVVTEWGELDGSFKGAIDCNLALSNAGYTVKS